jgi:DNA-binding NarL/FixJ family response regulator
MDIRLPVLDGIEAMLILTTFGLDEHVYDALCAGASGFMLKDAPPEEIAESGIVAPGGSGPG